MLDILLQIYVGKIKSAILKKNIEDQDLLFLSFTNLIELMNKLSILNEMDSERKKLIPPVVNKLNINI
jgi:hypothetical protein